MVLYYIMKYISGNYIGRVLGIGVINYGEGEEPLPCAVYFLSGRSRASRQRCIVDRRSKLGVRSRIIAPSEELELLEYDAMVNLSSALHRSNFLIVGNGTHTNHILKKLLQKEKPQNALRKALDELGPEPDEYYTPKIASVIQSTEDGTVAHLGRAARKRNVEIYDINLGALEPGELQILSTYSGHGPIPDVPEKGLRTLHIQDGVQNTAQLAQIFYKAMERMKVETSEGKTIDTRVATCAALFKHSEEGPIEFGIKNRYKF